MPPKRLARQEEAATPETPGEAEEEATPQLPEGEQECTAADIDVMWQELVEGLLLFTFPLHNSLATQGSAQRLYAYARSGPTLLDITWVRVELTLETADGGSEGTAGGIQRTVAQLLKQPLKAVRVVQSDRPKAFTVTVEEECGAAKGSPSSVAIAEGMLQRLATDMKKGALGKLGSVANIGRVRVTGVESGVPPRTLPVFRLPAWRRQHRASGPMLPYEERVRVDEEAAQFLGDIYLTPERRETGKSGPRYFPPGDVQTVSIERHAIVDRGLEYSVDEVVALVRTASKKRKKVITQPEHLGETTGSLGDTLVSSLCYSTNKNASVTHTPAREAWERLYSAASEGKRKEMRWRRQTMFTLLSDAILADRERRIGVLCTSSPLLANRPTENIRGLRNDDNVTRRKEATVYGKTAVRPADLQLAPDDPRSIHKALHRGIFQIASASDAKDASTLILNCQLMRNDKEPPNRFGWDSYCCIRGTGEKGYVQGITAKYGKVGPVV
eukprot:Sspe_Gene.67891::Locus_40041_Transcript_1_1_Confidence_1.000_Length_1598::g.67891::m.67891